MLGWGLFKGTATRGISTVWKTVQERHTLRELAEVSSPSTLNFLPPLPSHLRDLEFEILNVAWDKKIKRDWSLCSNPASG
jgi:hypothetical protein